MIQRVGKKEKKKLKAIQKNLQGGSLKPTILIKQLPNKIKPHIKYTEIPQITHHQQDNQLENSSLTIFTKNKKIPILTQQIMSVLQNHKKVQIIGENLQIPKTISIVEMIKRELASKNMIYNQNNILGVCSNKRPCIKIILELKDE